MLTQSALSHFLAVSFFLLHSVLKESYHQVKNKTNASAVSGPLRHEQERMNPLLPVGVESEYAIVTKFSTSTISPSLLSDFSM